MKNKIAESLVAVYIYTHTHSITKKIKKEMGCYHDTPIC